MEKWFGLVWLGALALGLAWMGLLAWVLIQLVHILQKALS